MAADPVYNVLGDRVRVLATGDGVPYEMFEWHGPENSGPVPHSHPWTESYFVVEGEADVVIGGKTLRATPGCLMSVPPHTVHSYPVTSPPPAFLGVAIAGKTRPATPGSFMPFPPDTVHSYRVPSPAAKFLVVTSPSGLKAFV